ncbi:MAG: T9SS type A sorting domain-containing protein, partial [Bacteroidetes bacterium]|nr:T9SS type A sorting domain-containing protein [Bacteroidota bacterium]
HDQYWHDIQDQTADNSFLQMAADGQSFFQASGDEDAITNSTWTNGSETVYSYFEFPEDDPNVTSVGGTKLTTTGPGGSYVSEVVWNPGTYGAHPYSFEGSTGGVSNLYSIPTWQQNANPSNAQVSSSYRNVPDVALVADSVYEYVDNTSIYNQGGTSAAAPLWAGFTAMVNQEAANNGQSTVGFINPAIYRVGQTSSYNYVFHDIPAGSQNNNKWPGSGSDFTASTGYDLTTGWGTPQGQNLINYLSGTAVTAAINGPSYLPPNQPGGYAALATGGTPPYSYQWWKLEETTAVPSSSSASPNIPPGNTWYEIGTNSPEVSTSDTYNFEIKCVMTDAFGKNSTSNIISVQVGGAGNTVASNPGTDAAVPQAVPKTNSLSQNYPNPFNPSTQIRFALSKDAQVRLVVYDVLGREVAQLADQDMTAGYHSVTWNANNVPSGVYIYRLSAGNFVQVKRMLLVK